MEKNHSEILSRIEYVTIKLGTNLLTPHIENKSDYFDRLASQINELRNAGKKVLVVSSGAVGMGKQIMAMKNDYFLKEHLSLREKTALASIGQNTLMNTYNHAFSLHNITPAQILLSKTDLINRNHFNTLTNTLNQTLDWGVIPIINENDAVATDELKFGDNDTLAGFIASMFANSLLIILTTIDAFYIKKKKIRLINHFRDDLLKYAGAPSSGGSGGMKSKLIAGKKMLTSGQVMNISDGQNPEVISDLMKGEIIGTWFIPKNKPAKARKRWLIHNRESAGIVHIDEGAEVALKDKGASLLIFGIQSTQGKFNKDQLIDIYNNQNSRIGKGVSMLNSDEIQKYLEMKYSTLDEKTEAFKGKKVIHRDTLILF